ncbi:hypothetical protein H4R19_001251 [Coemansia spiralis]|nr:hypothetical protein H4R19_001251 [Coemansia spiralis]
MLKSVFSGWRSAKTYGNPFEANVLVRVVGGGALQRSFFVHELPPDCPIGFLRERIEEKRAMIPFAQWEMCLPSRNGPALCDDLRFSDYGIKPWDCIFVRPVASLPPRPKSRRVSALAASLPFRIKRSSPDYASSRSATTVGGGSSARSRPSPYGYLDSAGTSLFSTESFDLGAETKTRHLL